MVFVTDYSFCPKQFKIRYLSQLQMLWRGELTSRQQHAVCQRNCVTAIPYRTPRRVSAELRHHYPVSNSTPCVSGTASPLSRISFEPRNLNKIFSIRSSWRFLSESVNRRHSFYRRTSRRREVYCTVAIAVAVSPPNGNPLNKSLRSAF